MLNKLLRWFEQNLNPSQQSSSEHTLKIATAVMFYEIIRADHKIDEQELTLLRQLLSDSFSLSTDELNELMQSAKDYAEEAVDMVQYTRVINEQCSREQKQQFILQLWQLAYADQALDGHEELLIRKISDLIYLNHSDYIQAKLKVVPA
ncbi:TerB family tellurite resistance protein [Neptunicella marina]|uniref:TerB family tellurite resistance protein n=1 Tax=Neptunicella marina TaxID=2125989 RepID=A0A8J6IPM8_9ALTE|nr:TerB family tellurite resistance protein [Neptunicella marina]MBC3764419.1 TerB family tellurite resistance protein [Neptunicella marina]